MWPMRSTPGPAHLPLAVLPVLKAIQHGAALAELHHQMHRNVVLEHVLQQELGTGGC